MIENVIGSTDVALRVAIGLFGAALVSTAAVRLRILSISGGIAATVVGALAVGAGWSFALVLLGFFASASALSRYKAATKDARTSRIVAKGGARDALQVLANGGVFAVAALWMILAPEPTVAFAAIGALAGATADTWATEIGSLSRTNPRSIITWKRVPPGTSGGVSSLGASAAVAGAGFTGLLAWIGGMPIAIIPACLVSGVVGAAVDSIIGASIQSRRWCKTCREFTEREIHPCGTSTERVSGVSWIDNDTVNLACTATAAGVAALWVL